MSNKISAWIQELRIPQYAKNLFIFLPAFFAGCLSFDLSFVRLLLIFLLFSFAASACYLFNDLHDLASDKKRERTKDRPLVKGDISRVHALIGAIFLMALSSVLTFLQFGLESFVLLIAYFLLNLIYTLFSKKIPPLDILLVSCCFLCRIFIGASVAHVACSAWLIVMTFLLTLLLALGKRYGELPIPGYTEEYAKIGIVFLCSAVCSAYIVYILISPMSSGFSKTYSSITILPVVYGILRYLQCVFVFRKSPCPSTLFLHDRHIQISVLVWGILSYLLIYAIH